MTKIIAAILTKNEARHIGDCIKSVQWADAVILEDSFSDDGTVEIAKDLGVQVFQNEFVNFAVARDTALKNAQALQGEWILFIDADERVTPELAEEIRRVTQDSRAVGWWAPRYNIMWGHTMRGGGWYPDYQLRLMRIDAARYDPERQVHEIVLLDGQADYLKEHLIHYNYDSLTQFKFKQDRYIDFEAKILKKKGIRAKPWTYLTMPLREFRRRYISLGGYQDGWVGLQVCSLMSWYMFITYLRLRKLYQVERSTFNVQR
ncbi:MAG: glycosyltransferase family 2 protein [Anaerolineae bacterium]|nr:glycosyltransferase family 2 protein [Anaerolineae bacterium]